MSELDKLLSEPLPLATVATPATQKPESSRSSKCSRPRHAGMRLLAGDECREIPADPDQLAAFKAAAEIADQIQKGIVPEHYTAITECRHCGPVPVFQGLPAKVNGCTWCLNRVADRPVPNVSDARTVADIKR